MAYEFREITRDASLDEKLIRHYTRRFQVITDEPDIGPFTASGLVPISMYDSYSAGGDTDLTALCKKITASQTGQEQGGYVWDIVFEYDSAPFDQREGGTSPSGDPGQSQTQPDMRPWQIEIGSVKTSKILKVDIEDEDKKVAASNGQPFDPPIEIPAHHPQITITAFKAIGADSLANIVTYTNAVNDGAWEGFADQTVKCTEYKLTSQFEHNAWWWQKTVTFEVDTDGPWNPIQILDAGTVYKESESKPPQPILDGTGNPTTSPLPLDGEGQPLNAGEDLVYLEFNGYRKVSFASII